MTMIEEHACLYIGASDAYRKRGNLPVESAFFHALA
jgi:hypothetical protein